MATPFAQLEALFATCFSSDELLALVRRLSDGAALSRGLRPNAPLDALASDLTALLERRARVDAELFAELQRATGARKSAEVARVAAAWGIDVAVATRTVPSGGGSAAVGTSKAVDAAPVSVAPASAAARDSQQGAVEVLAVRWTNPLEIKAMAERAGLVVALGGGDAPRDAWRRVLQAWATSGADDLLDALARERPDDAELGAILDALRELRPPSAPAQVDAPRDLFCVYRSTDCARVRCVVREVEARGLRVFLDADETVPGDAWLEVLERGLQSVRGALVFLSPAALQSRFVQQEQTFLLGRHAKDPSFRIVPVLLDDCETPPYLQFAQHLDLRGHDPCHGLPAHVTEAIDKLAIAMRPAGG